MADGDPTNFTVQLSLEQRRQLAVLGAEYRRPGDRDSDGALVRHWLETAWARRERRLARQVVKEN